MLVGGHVGNGSREGYGLPMEVLVAKRSPQWWEAAMAAAGLDVDSHVVSSQATHHVMWATAR